MADSVFWPQGYRCAVVLTVDYNDIHGILTQAPEVAGRDKTLSVWRYGTQRGVERLLGLFDELKVCSSWFIPGIVAEKTRNTSRRFKQAGTRLPAPVIATATTTLSTWRSSVTKSPEGVQRCRR